MTQSDKDDALMRAAAMLPEEIQPERDLWPAIAAQLEPSPGLTRRRPTWPLALAASLALVAVTAGITWRLATPDRPLPQTAIAGVYQPNSELMVTRTRMFASLENNLARLPADSQRIVVENLMEIRESLAAIESALASDPANSSLQQLLFTTYQQELMMLADINRVALSLPPEVET